MITYTLQQGKPEWHAFRANHHTASEASSMMGFHKKTSRNELLHMKATGGEKEFSDWVQKNLLNKGHKIEAAARPVAERIIGKELFPSTGADDDDYLSASYDGITMIEDVCWECKSWNEAKAAEVREGRVPEEDYWQVVQQLVVSGAGRCLYMVTDGTEENTVTVWKSLEGDDVKSLMAGWKQFDIDLANYQHVEEATEAVAVPVENLPALLIDLVGDVKDSNLVPYSEAVAARIKAINTDLQTDQDFIDAAEMVKFLKNGEDEVKAAKKQALAKTASIEALFNAVDLLSEEMRKKRLDLDKLVKARKDSLRIEIQQAGQTALQDHINSINNTLEGVSLPDYQADFAGAMKGKRTISSLRDAVDTELARAKIDTNAMADEIRANLKTLNDLDQVGDYRFLFNDIKQIISKPNDDFSTLVKLRINEHVQAEAKRLEQERERIRMEEEEKAKRKTEAEQAEARRLEEEQAPEEQSNCPAPQKAAQPGPSSTPKPTAYSTPQPTGQNTRPANVKATINNEALKAFVSAGLSAESAKLAVTAIAQGKVAHVSINYQQQVAP